MRRLHLLALIALTATGVLGSLSSAGAAPNDAFQYQGSFPIPGVENPNQFAVNNRTGNLLVFGQGQVTQYDPTGDPVEFSDLGSPTISIGTGDGMYVDNSGGPTQGNIYVFSYSDCVCNAGGEHWWAFGPDGGPVGTNPHSIRTFGESAILGAAVAPDSKVWIFTRADLDSHIAARPFGPDGTPIEAETPLEFDNSNFAIGSYIGNAFDELGYYYAPDAGGAYRKFGLQNNVVELGPTGLASSESFAIDPSTNDQYVRAGGSVVGVPFSDPLKVNAPPIQTLNGINGNGPIAFAGDGKTIYVSEGSQVGVFSKPVSIVPGIAAGGIKDITTSRATLTGQVTNRGAPTSYHLEYGTSTAYGNSTPPVASSPNFYSPVDVVASLANLQPGTTYHVRYVATNAAGTTTGPDTTFTTYPAPGDGVDTCPNALARKQTLASRLPDCRAYELVSATDTRGFDVESYLAPGQTPFPGFPMATDKLLYALHSGAVPGPWNATNHGPDPYLATRTSSGWVTDYKGLPADINPEAGSFSSVLGEADSQLNTLAFAGPNLCDPCFTDGGLRTGIPVRLSSGQLVQGMTGSLAGSVPNTAKPEGDVAKYFSGDGKHLLFASKYAFEPGANTGGDLTIYDRNLATGKTQIASTDPAGNPLTGTVSELDVSSNGSRIVSARQISVDGQGNAYTHPYMHVGSSPNGVDLTPGTTTGVLYAGMTADGSKVFFATKDKLDTGDTDNSADLYEAAVDGSGNLDLNVVTEADSDACSPVANSNGAHWNTTGAAVNCDVVAISGGGGVASFSGAIYFLSPESFGGEGTANQPNLYLAQPGGSPSFVATLEPDNPLVLDSVKANAARRTGDFQTTSSGNYAAFVSSLELTGVDHFGFRNVFRYDAGAGQLACPSCDPTGATLDNGLNDDVEMAPSGLSLLGDGRVFFTTRFPLAPTDPNKRDDVYEWTAGRQELISAGTGPFDSALLSASADGNDVFFFTRDVLAAEEDSNGSAVRIYDAREGGGYFKLPPPVPCQASDECHGPGTATPPAPDIRSSGKTTAGNVLVCPKNRVKKRGQCVKKPAQRKPKKKAKKNAKKRAAKTTGKRGGRNA